MVSVILVESKLQQNLPDLCFEVMASAGVAPASGVRDVNASSVAVERLPDEMNGMKIRDERVKLKCLFYLGLFAFHFASRLHPFEQLADKYVVYLCSNLLKQNAGNGSNCGRWKWD